MHFLKAGLLFSASTLSKLLAGLLVIKVIAVSIGAEGLGRLGQFMSLMSMITIVAGGGITTGIIKYVAEHRQSPDELTGYLRAASFITLVASSLVGALLLLGAPWIAAQLLGDPIYANVIRVLALAQALVALSNLLMGLVNGHQRVTTFAVINALGVVIGTAGFTLACYRWGIRGAMYGLIWLPACVALLLVPWYRLVLKFEWRRLLPARDWPRIRRLMGFSLMLLTSVVTMQMSQIVIRSFIEARQSWVEVGYWQAVTKISDVYLQFITVVLANYYLPRLSVLRNRDEVAAEVALAYRYAMPVLLLMSGAVYVCRDWIILLLFSREFAPMKEYFTWQLAGDSFKVAAYVGAYVAVARANTRAYIAAEVFQATLLIALSYVMVQAHGAVGATYAYCATYIVYFVVVYFFLSKYLRKDGVA